MTFVNKIVRLFKAARDRYAKVYGSPSNNNVISFKEYLLNVCLKIAFKRTDAGDPSGAILEDAHYKRVNMNRSLYKQQVATRKFYDNIIAFDDPL